MATGLRRKGLRKREAEGGPGRQGQARYARVGGYIEDNPASNGYPAASPSLVISWYSIVAPGGFAPAVVAKNRKASAVEVMKLRAPGHTDTRPSRRLPRIQENLY